VRRRLFLRFFHASALWLGFVCTAAFGAESLASVPADSVAADTTHQPSAHKSLYFDALGWDSATSDVFDHFTLARWWIYGEGADKTFVKYLKKNRKGTFYTNLADSYIYQIRNGITDAEMLDQCRSMLEKYNLEELWYSGLRIISTSKEVFDLYHAFINNTHTGERVIYQSPLYKASYTD